MSRSYPFDSEKEKRDAVESITGSRVLLSDVFDVEDNDYPSTDEDKEESN